MGTRKVVVVTGATAVIGEAACQRFQAASWMVFRRVAPENHQWSFRYV